MVRTRLSKLGRGLTGGLPSWAKPSKIVAYTGIATGTMELVFTPLPNGDSWLRRLMQGYTTYKTSGNVVDILNEDVDGNNAITIATYQLKQNAVPAAVTIIGFGLGASVLKYFGM